MTETEHWSQKSRSSEDVEPLVVVPEAAAVVQVSTVGIKSRVLQEESRGSASGSVREDRSRCVIMEVAAEPENFVGSSGGLQMPLWSTCRLRSGGNCWGVISSAGVASSEDAAELPHYRRWCQKSPLFGLLHV